MDRANEIPSVPDDLQAILRRLTEVDQILEQAKEERVFLRERIVELMTANQERQRRIEVDGQPMMLRVHVRRKVRYDEEVLRERLGDRYRQILSPDARKVRKHAAELGDALDEHLELIGSPTPDRVQAAIEGGLVRADEFRGAFRKDTTRVLNVRKAPQRAAEVSADEDRPF